MKLRMLGWGAAVLLTASGAVPSAAQAGKEDVTKHPGYVAFDTFGLFGQKEPDVEVLIEKELIEMVGAFSKASDPELADMLAKLLLIRVQSFSIKPSQLSAVEEKTQEISKKVESQGWTAAVRVRNTRENEQTYVYMKLKDKLIQGLMVMNVDPNDKEQVSFVNIVGEIDPEQLGRLQRKFNIDGLDSLKAFDYKSTKSKSH